MANVPNYKRTVVEEIENIKKYATKEEISRLNLKNLDPNLSSGCIYGQMAGSCNNDRGIELIRLCCKTATSFRHVGDSRVQKTHPRTATVLFDSYSYLENFIFRYNHEHNNKNIISYLKGETEVLEKLDTTPKKSQR